jgi:hypothetical protein
MKKHNRLSNAVYSEAKTARSGLRPWLFFFVAGLFYNPVAAST